GQGFAAGQEGDEDIFLPLAVPGANFGASSFVPQVNLARAVSRCDALAIRGHAHRRDSGEWPRRGNLLLARGDIETPDHLVEARDGDLLAVRANRKSVGITGVT